MKISYNKKGKERKALVLAISEELDAQADYKGAPTFAYEVGGYVIDKEGTLTGEDNRGLVADLCGLHSLEAVTEEYDVCPPEAEDAPEFEELILTEREELGLGRERREDFAGENGPSADDVPDPAVQDDGDLLTIEMPLEGFTEEAIENLELLVASKATLIKNAIGAEELPIERTGDKLRFPWFRGGTGTEEASAYSLFIGALCAAAKEVKRVTAKDKPVENEKFAFRVFLIRLGFVGDEYKQARRILLTNLPGNSAFKNGRPDKEVCADGQ
jgi:hypothetical protein